MLYAGRRLDLGWDKATLQVRSHCLDGPLTYSTETEANPLGHVGLGFSAYAGKRVTDPSRGSTMFREMGNQNRVSSQRTCSSSPGSTTSRLGCRSGPRNGAAMATEKARSVSKRLTRTIQFKSCHHLSQPLVEAACIWTFRLALTMYVGSERRCRLWSPEIPMSYGAREVR